MKFLFLFLFVLILDYGSAVANPNVYEDSCFVKVPDAFSPNGDKVHDGLVVKSNCEISNYELIIMNRWGQVVFKTDDIVENWDGHEMTVGTYFWTVTGHFKNSDREVNSSGYVTLIR